MRDKKKTKVAARIRIIPPSSSSFETKKKKKNSGMSAESQDHWLKIG
jgi:hypothetical protein